MRSKVTLILIAVSIIALVLVAIEGINIGNFQILSVSQLIEKNNDLNEKINNASDLSKTKYIEAGEKLEKTYEKFEIQKQKYEEISGLTDKELKEIYEKRVYDVGYLWEVIGKSATKRNLKIAINVVKTTGEDIYNLNFNVSGKYANTIQFISDLENNSDLNFRIYNFKMTGSGEEVQTTFTVRNIGIDSKTTTSASYNTNNLESSTENIDAE